ncbi:MAG: FAD binding domain-containing protein [Anaerolineae bacterium]
MQDFVYHSPGTLAEAITLLAEAAADGRRVYPLAGGTDLVPQMKEGLRAPGAVVNLKRISGLNGISRDEAGLRLGPLVTATDLMESAVIREHYPVLAEAAATMAGVQICNMATVGGNLCNASPAADLAPPLIALRAVAQIAGPSGTRSVALDEFFTGPGQTALAPDELLTEITVPASAAGAAAVYLKHAPRQAMEIAVVGVGAALWQEDGTCDDVRLVLGAVAPIPLRARRAEDSLRGGPLDDEAIAAAARLAAEEARPIDDLRGSAWYRRRMVEVLARRGLQRMRDERRA